LEGSCVDLGAEGLVPGARHMLVASSGHYVLPERPELVIDATRDVVAAPNTNADPGMGRARSDALEWSPG
jgi:hypothetical protein